ncbi:carboxylate--amine ligase [Wenjunlia vitaminophila]|uniref:Putative glutamate--cysteine ligase 2 n=1 Tax=Wenjunlia vitaminophila TaxID=76728 RepID=A0A0T6LUP6_WENVI|nr:glutamate--cysteine ligase [Wenjunlia vitaminophila]KRV49764.1 carboxylate--amine ligase [Wenjunlia vitaminophila]
MDTTTVRSVGVEEELLLVDPATGHPRAVAGAVLRSPGDNDPLVAELQREQLETGTRPCLTMDELSDEVRRWRREASERARQADVEVAALATSPLPVDPSVSPMARYRRICEEYGLTAQEQLTCGCHVHVGVESDEEGVAVLDRVRPWLAPLIALSGNSPFWQGRDTGYTSYRSQVWSRWPSSGPVELFGSAKRYHAAVQAMVDSGTLLDRGMVYFDARLSANYPTVEIRVADVCLDADDTVLIAALIRALVETAAREWLQGEPPDPMSVPLLRLASWRAGRSGLDGQLLHPVGHTPVPAEQVLRTLVEHCAAALISAGDLALVQERVHAVLRRGNGAAAQHEALRGGGGLAGVVATAVARTAA